MLSLLFGPPPEPQSSIELTPTSSQILSPDQFADLCERDPTNIEHSNYVAPSIGDDHFGYFRVELRRPLYSHSTPESLQ